MKRKFSTREKVLLVILAVLLVGSLYYVAVDQPVRNTIADATARQQEAESALTIDLAKLARMHQMQAALAELEQDAKPNVPDFDNARYVIRLLDTVLSQAEGVVLTFPQPVTKGDIVRRSVDMRFVCSGYASARRILDKLYNGPFRCEIANFSMTDLTGEYTEVLATVTFFEFVVDEKAPE